MVGFLTDFVFGDPSQLYLSLALTALLTIPPAIILLGWGLKHYRASVEESVQWREAPA